MEDLGAEEISDLKQITEEDLKEAGVKKIPMRKFMDAIKRQFP